MQHGILSRHTVLAHEDPDEYRALLAALVEEHQPAAAIALAGCMTEAWQRLFPEAAMPGICEAHIGANWADAKKG